MLKSELSENGVLTLTLASPPANTLSIAMIDALSDALDAVDAKTRVIVLQAEGKVFSAGHDIKELTTHRGDPDGGKHFFDETFKACAAMMQKVVHARQPVIAKVHTLATAAGCQLVASCDLAIASEKARFCTPGVNIGLFCSTPMVAVTRNLSRKHAMEMLLTGEEISAQKAYEFGLVNEVVPHEELDRRVDEVANLIASKSSYVVQLGKKAFHEQAGMGLADAYMHCGVVMAENMMAEDAKEGLGAIMEKRQAAWQDK